MDPNSPINQPASTSPQSITTSQPMTQSGLPPESIPVGPSPKSGSKKWLIIAAVLVLLILLGGGIYAFATLNTPKTENVSSNVVTIPSPTLSPPVPASSSAVATSSAGFDQSLENSEKLKSDVKNVASAMSICWQANKAYTTGKCNSVANLQDSKYLGPQITNATINISFSKDLQNAVVYTKLFNQEEVCELVPAPGGTIRYFVYHTKTVKAQVECLSADPIAP